MRQVILSEFISETVTHISTSWKYFKDEDMNEAVLDNDDNPIEITDSELMKNVWYVPTPISDHSFYVFYKRGYDDDDDGEKDLEDDDWGMIEIEAQELSGVYLSVESHVEAPSLIGDETLTIDDYAIDVSMTTMKPDIVPHKDTTYIVKKLDGSVIYFNANNTSNLTENRINLDPDYVSKYEDYILIVTYRNKNNVMSQPLIVYVNAEDKGVEPTTSIKDIIAELDFKLTLSNQDDLNYVLTIKDEFEERYRYEGKDTALTITPYTLDPYKSYTLSIEVDGVTCFEDTLTTKVISSFDLNFTEAYSLNHKITNGNFIESDIIKYYLEPLENNVNLVFNSDNQSLKFVRSTLDVFQSVETNFTLPIELDTDRIYVYHMRDNKVGLLGNKKDTNDWYMFILRYNVFHYSLNLVTYKKLYNIHYNNTILGFSHITYNPFNDKIYYLGKNTDGDVFIYSYDYGSDNIRRVTAIPKLGYKYYILGFVDYDRLFYTAAGKDDNDEYNGLYYYNIIDNSFDSFGSFPSEFEDSNLSITMLPNNSLLMLDILGNNEDYLTLNLTNDEIEIISKDSDYSHGNKYMVTNNHAIYILKNDGSNEVNKFD